MKTIISIILFGFACILQLQAQEKKSTAIQTGTWLVESSLNPSVNSSTETPTTGVGFHLSNDSFSWSVGTEAGYFIANNLALKVGIGVSQTRFGVRALDGPRSIAQFSYRVGLKYFIGGKFPIQVDFSGVRGTFGNNSSTYEGHNLYVGLQAGYSIFLNDRIAFEPGLRYNVLVSDTYGFNGSLEPSLGVSVFFNRKKR